MVHFKGVGRSVGPCMRARAGASLFNARLSQRCILRAWAGVLAPAQSLALSDRSLCDLYMSVTLSALQTLQMSIIETEITDKEHCILVLRALPMHAMGSSGGAGRGAQA
eukprot:1161694-Pelagomonas_calceolata.AAC.7